MEWTPTAELLYLQDPGPRAIFQGDVYSDVPYTKAAAGNSTASDPSWSAKRRHVATLLHPCYMVTDDNVTAVKAQPVACVYDAAASGLTISADWEDVPAAVCPFPDLEGDGRMWVADFRMITTVDRSYLLATQRVRSLSAFGWAVFRQRYILAATRALFALDDLMKVGAATWDESEMETCAIRRSA